MTTEHMSGDKAMDIDKSWESGKSWENGNSWEIASGGGLTAPIESSHHYASALAEWRPTASPGFWIKPLYTDSARGEKTMLMKVDAGAFAPLHNHDGEFEQVYVIEGTFYDQHRTMTAGDYCCRAPDALHLSGSRDGAIIMIIYTRRAPE